MLVTTYVETQEGGGRIILKWALGRYVEVSRIRGDPELTDSCPVVSFFIVGAETLSLL